MDLRLQTLKSLLDIAGTLHKSGKFAEKTAAVFIYLNVIEEITVYLIYEIQIENNKQSQIKIKLDDEYLEKLTIGQKLGLLKHFEFHNSNKIIDLLTAINKDRIVIVHNLLTCVLNKEADTTIDRVCKNCQQFRGEFGKVLEHNLKK